jgi:hypothetical protein
MLTASAEFTAALAASHHPLIRLGVWLPDLVGVYTQIGYLGVTGGSLTLDYRRNVRRQASITVASYDLSLDTDYATTLETRDYLEALTTQSGEVTLEWGLLYPDGTDEWVTLARLRVDESNQALLSGELALTSLLDTGSRVSDFPLATPYAPYDINGTKLTYLEAIQDLVNTSFPSGAPPTWDITIGIDDTSLPPDGTVFTGDRWSAITALAQAINVVVGPDHVGDWIIDTATPAVYPTWDVSPGENGVLVDAPTFYSRREQYNAIPVRWEAPDGSGGLVYLVDADPDSPTYYDGPFGRKPRPEETLSAVTTEDQAIAAAATLLEQYRGKTRSVSLTSVHNPLMEPNDRLALWFPDGTAELHVIDSITLPLGEGTMTCETRNVRPTGVTYEEAGLTYEDSGYTYDGHEVGGS